ncbi:MAG TPA: molybdopterin converting factor subunit 1 [Burkholderiales bacterium]|jgi:molybdopterin synthase sulfur carrier subunit|nr:molybdopterin converting factor subunit 1 [Burkholderiales bacterium]
MKPADSQTAVVRLRYFARLREALDCSEEELVVPAGVRTVSDLMAFLRTRGGAWAAELAAGRPVLVAVNEDMADADRPIGHGDTVAFMPPVTGG